MESEQKTRREGGEEEERLSNSGSRTSIGNSHSEPFQRDERAEAQGRRQRLTVSREKKNKTVEVETSAVYFLYEWTRSVQQKNGALLTFANPSFQSKVEPDLGVFSWRHNEQEKGL